MRAITITGRPAAAPRRPDGELYRFELIDPGGRWRAYADEPAALTAELIGGYADLSETDRARARTDLAVRAQVVALAAQAVPPAAQTAPIEAGDDVALLRTLHRLGLVVLAELMPAPPGPMTPDVSYL
jgi:hypothetical protein